MNDRWKRAFIIAATLHVALFFTAVFVGWVASWQDEPETLVFELVPDAGPSSQMQVEEPLEESEPLDSIKVDQVQKLREIPEVPNLPEPEPEPEPEPVQQKVSYEEWAKSRKLPERVQRVEVKRNATSEVKEIQTNVRDRLSKVLSPIRISGVNVLAPVNTNELQAYLSRLREEIQSYFNPTDRGLSVETRFEVGSNGQILNPRIIRSSGDNRFDQASLLALQRAKPIGPPPGNQVFTFELTFRGD